MLALVRYTLIATAGALMSVAWIHQENPDIPIMVRKVSPSVVNIAVVKIETEKSAVSGFFEKKPSEKDKEKDAAGVGSGFIISKDGYILTNAHVAEGAKSLKVKLDDGREFDAILIGLDERTDVALIKISGPLFSPVKLGDSNKIQVGESVVAIGSPHGLEKTVTAGIVSNTNREIGEFLRFIQTDVAINPGNSGGPLFNKRGEVIGINSMILSLTGGYAGISLAIPINDALNIADQLIANGKVERGRLGISVTALEKEKAKELNFDLDYGVLVRSVQKGGPAELFGIKETDIILECNRIKIKDPISLIRVVTNSKPGTQIVLHVWRNGEILRIAAVLDTLK